jgi:peptidoglycan/LPS O-acetylase OafA/YrhL
MSEPARTPPPPAGSPKNRGLGWFFVVLGAVVLLLTVVTILTLTEGDFSGQSGELALLCGSPTLILGGVFLWLGSRRLKR